MNADKRYPSTREQSFLYITSLEEERIEQEELLAEYSLKVYVDDAFAMTLVCTPTDVEALVLGCLYTEGIISSCEDLASMQFNENDFSVHVVLHSSIKQEDKYKEDFRRYLPEQISLQPEWVCSMAKVFEKDTFLHQKTYGTHSCFLGICGKVIYSCEDIGRHNAIDKVIGMALKDGVDLTQTMIFTSGRIPMDMVEKVIHAGIPVLITKAKPTIQSIECAKKHGLILIGSARSDSFKLYTPAGNIK